MTDDHATDLGWLGVRGTQPCVEPVVVFEDDQWARLSHRHPDIRTTQWFLDYVMTPDRRLHLRARARHYGTDNRTPQSQWRYVTQDTSNLNGSVSFKNKRVDLSYASDRTTAGAEATFRARPARRPT